MRRRLFLKAGGAALVWTAAGGLASLRGPAAWLPGGLPARAAEPPRGDELAALDAVAQAELVRRGEVEPRELVDAAVSRLEAVDPRLGALVTPLFERARERVAKGLPEGPLRGVPTLFKDLMPYEGARITDGARVYADHVSPVSHAFARRMEAAGLVALGISKSPEFGLLPVTEPRVHGPARNPWDPEHTPGGSSGGAAAAVAAGAVPLAQASDGGGSIRIPASCCGLFGLKVSRGREPQRPRPDELGLAVRHCVSRSVRDSAVLLDAVAGALPGDRWQAPRPRRPFRRAVEADPGRLRIAVLTADLQGRSAHPDCVEAVESTADLCRELGHRVDEAVPEIDGAGFAEAFSVLWEAGTQDAVTAARRALGRMPDREAFEPFTWALAERAGRRTPADLLRAFHVLDAAGYRLAEFQERYDVLLSPVLAEPPWPVGHFDQSRPVEELSEQLTRYVAWTPLANTTGQPAMSVPLFWNEAGLPIGSHFQARYGEEATLLALAAQLERARPWVHRRPPVWSG